MFKLPKLRWSSEDVYQYIVYFEVNESFYEEVTVFKPNRQFDADTITWSNTIIKPQRVRSPSFSSLVII